MNILEYISRESLWNQDFKCNILVITCIWALVLCLICFWHAYQATHLCPCYTYDIRYADFQYYTTPAVNNVDGGGVSNNVRRS